DVPFHRENFRPQHQASDFDGALRWNWYRAGADRLFLEERPIGSTADSDVRTDLRPSRDVQYPIRTQRKLDLSNCRRWELASISQCCSQVGFSLQNRSIVWCDRDF